VWRVGGSGYEWRRNRPKWPFEGLELSQQEWDLSEDFIGPRNLVCSRDPARVLFFI
jgi:hypothetical protein